jgi:F-type H+-transporting ATPase subunit beta
MDDLHLNVSLLRARVPNLTVTAREVGLRPATVSNLCTGKIPIGRAEVQTLAKLASLAGCTMDELIIHGNQMGMIETGIKVLDLLAPIVKGGTVGIVAGPHTGQLVMLAELMNRFNKNHFATIFWKPTQDSVGIDEVVQESEVTCNTLEQVYNKILEFTKQREVILGADRSMVLSGELFNLDEKLQSAGIRTVTTILVDTGWTSVDEELPYGPLDTFLKFDTELTTRGLYPAVDPVISTSVTLEGAQLGSTHLSIQQRARKLLRRYRELRPIVVTGREDILPESELKDYNRGERLEAYLSQPFYIAELYTKKPGEWVSLQDTLEDVRRILDGGTDHLKIEELKLTGRFVSNPDL